MFLFALVMALLITSCGQKQKGSNTLIRPVKTAQVSSQSVIRKDFSGIVEAVEYVRLAFRVSCKQPHGFYDFLHHVPSLKKVRNI